MTKNLGVGIVVTRINLTTPRPFTALRVTLQGTFDTIHPFVRGELERDLPEGGRVGKDINKEETALLFFTQYIVQSL